MNTRVKIKSTTRTIIILLIVNAVIISALSMLSPNFLTISNIRSLFSRMSEMSILSIGVTIVFICGGFDLSIGAVMALTGMLMGVLREYGYPFGICLLAGVLAGVVVGVCNSFLIINLDLPSFLVTLGTMSIVRSVVYGVMKGRSFSKFPEWYLKIGEINIGFIPLIFIIYIILALLASLFMKKSIVGREIFAAGGNEKAAFISGIRIKRVKYLVYILSGFISSIAGLVFTIRLRTATPDTGLNTPLEVITAVMIGGTVMTGGKGTILGSSLGVLATFLLINGFNLLDISVYWQQVVLGIILISVIGYPEIEKTIKRKRD